MHKSSIKIKRLMLLTTYKILFVLQILAAFKQLGFLNLNMPHYVDKGGKKEFGNLKIKSILKNMLFS